MKKHIIFHPVLLALYPILALYGTNFESIRIKQILSSVGITFVTLILLWLLLKYLVRDVDKAAVIVSSFILLFFFYGHFLNALQNFLYSRLSVDSQAVILLTSKPALSITLVVWAVLFAFILVLAIKSRSNFRAVTNFLNVFSVVLIGFSVYGIAQNSLSARDSLEKISMMPEAEIGPQGDNDLPLHQAAPVDIYYIILDGYARSDVMANLYDYDNSEFVEFLQENGFYVASQAHSNYNYTYISLTSALNMDYLTQLTGYYEPTETSTFPVQHLFENNALTTLLKPNGYTIVSLPAPTGFLPELPADTQLIPPSRFNTFDVQLMNTTPLRLVLHDTHYQLHREWIDFQFREIPSLDDAEIPRFVFAHILSPHPPFVFAANGEPINPDWEFSYYDADYFVKWYGRETYIQNYREQSIYVTSRVEAMIRELLTRDPSPIIILQSDHGPGSQHNGLNPDLTNVDERFSILNAYYFPDQNYASLYPEISPVNSFRIVLNQYFGAAYPLLDDKSFWINSELPYNPVDITERLTTQK